MEQSEFSEYIISGLLIQFPQFKICCTNKPGGVVDIDYKSNLGKLTLWMTTQNKEVTIGFSDDADLSDFHTHMSLFGANTPDEELQRVITFIADILASREQIVYSSKHGYALFDEDDIAYRKQSGEVIEIKYWTDDDFLAT